LLATKSQLLTGRRSWRTPWWLCRVKRTCGAGRKRSKRRGGEVSLPCPCFFFSRCRKKRASKRKIEDAPVFSDCKSRAGPQSTSPSCRSRPSTAAMDHMSSLEVLRGGGEDGELERGARPLRREPWSECSSNYRNASSLSLEAFRERATKPSADGAPARRPFCVSDLRASTQRHERACSLPLCSELEEREGARDVPEGREAEREKKKKTSKTFFLRRQEV